MGCGGTKVARIRPDTLDMRRVGRVLLEPPFQRSSVALSNSKAASSITTGKCASLNAIFATGWARGQRMCRAPSLPNRPPEHLLGGKHGLRFDCQGRTRRSRLPYSVSTSSSLTSAICSRPDTIHVCNPGLQENCGDCLGKTLDTVPAVAGARRPTASASPSANAVTSIRQRVDSPQPIVRVSGRER